MVTSCSAESACVNWTVHLTQEGELLAVAQWARLCNVKAC